MFAEQNNSATTISRRVVEAKLVESRNRFLGFLRRRLSRPQDAEDVFQDFCVKVLRHHAQIEDDERLDAWLGVTLKHTLTDHYRRQAARNRGAEAYAIETKVTQQEDIDVAEPACTCIAAAMKMLQPSQAELLARIDLRDEPRTAVATELGLNSNSLGVRVHRARTALRKKIAEVCKVCGEGGFMICDCDHSRGDRPSSTPRQFDAPPSVMSNPVARLLI
ncbi:MAG: RNA polymerase subunit sigma-70 [Hoeflea sp.]|jgi:RNA polymerase sigma factor (sigma-70 family)|uniref:RNA polymerase sigma factor n=1 Tax=Hoeflea sp. TaxID=1940281 RepID=UPI000C10B187|nr:RNA polymerase sigma factor [Hoeflea sp.]PHR22911.1 MAG: RNA polymerase subunit sigma-70 [Hoeflea sp.]|tara:strand:+ start:431 stop:1090 length:660 start_codon:yes stop_codon:yes gene_type:complete